MDLHAQALTVRRGGKEVLKNIDLTLPEGLCYLAGSNGSGKTTLLHTLCGLLPYHGNLTIGGQAISHLTTLQLAKTVSLVSQFTHIPFSLSVTSFILMGRFPYLPKWGSYSDADMKMARNAMKEMGLREFADRNVKELSGGEFQRVSIARAICQDTPILLLDEPDQSLDPRGREFLYGYLASKAKNKTILCSTHDLEPMTQSNVRTIGLHKGKIVWDQQGGTRSEMMEQIFPA
ncbi:ABC transporter ATP-binding protein [Pontibacter sp. G13]|uniref:ABC transporter ATP-binding protein n=1 Tax=Pontibacter sp. G13 TaxID=3074898 RepID=UPI00288BFA63|nr:ABC transporter ATP-binding protein [Pontibacter sp. G13]WNJ18845.1 ABC transporter ATP-binding protein [Pontibacter sp. G13]